MSGRVHILESKRSNESHDRLLIEGETDSMRGAGILEYGGAIQLLDLPDPELSEPQQLLIEVRAAGVGNWDDVVRTGNWDVGSTPPMALGVEAAGTVLAIGPGVARFRVGDEVLTHPLPLPQQGTWAEALVAREGMVALKPSGMSVAVAGLFPVPALTASQVLSDAVGLSPGETIIVQGAGGITGGMIVALAAEMGGRVIAIAGAGGAERLRAYGASVVLDYHQPDWQHQARELVPGGATVAVNAVRGAAAGLVTLVADGGRLATITGDPPGQERGIRVSNCYVRPDGLALQGLAANFAERGLTLPVVRVRRLVEAASALSEVTSGQARGGVLIDPRH